MAETAGLVLAGGAARRMGGGDKTLRPLGGEATLARILRVLRPELPLLAISANGDPERFRDFGLPVLADAAPVGAAGDGGPLAGVLAGLDWAAAAGASALLTVPGDTPFIPPRLASRLAPAPAVAASGGRVHHLVALWPVVIRHALRAHLARSAGREVRLFAATLSMRVVSFPDATPDPFFNLNTPADFAAAERWVGTEPRHGPCPA